MEQSKVVRALKRNKAFFAALGTLGVLAGGGAIAQAALTPNDEVQACYEKTTGALRVSKRCTSNELPISWTKSGKVGPAGPAGARGPQGAVGATGAEGKPGPQGPLGATGAQGQVGATGLKGDAGPIGPKGAAGVQGQVGATGLKGDTGPIGPIGAIGPMGLRGEQGLKGDTGATGATGAKGDAGPLGQTGLKGDQGLKGDTGATGATGARGATGATGAAGPQGPAGPSGPSTALPEVWPTPYENSTNSSYTAVRFAATGEVVTATSFGGCHDNLTELEDCYLELPAVTPVLAWISETLDLSQGGAAGEAAAARRNISIIQVTVANNQATRQVVLGNAFWRTFEMGPSDGSSKLPTSLRLIVVPQTITSPSTGGVSIPPPAERPTVSSNFRVEIDGLLTNRIYTVRGLSAKRPKVRGANNPKGVATFSPGAMAFSNLDLETITTDAAQYGDWVDDLIADPTDARNGILSYLSPTLKDEIWSIELQGLRPLRRPDPLTISTRQTIPLSVEQLFVNPPGSQ